MILRWLWLLLTLPAMLLAVLFAVSNRQAVAINLFPLPFSLELPVYLFAFGVAALALFSGLLLGWLAGYPQRLTARRDRRRLADLEKEMGELRAGMVMPDAPPVAGSRSASLVSR